MRIENTLCAAAVALLLAACGGGDATDGTPLPDTSPPPAAGGSADAETWRGLSAYLKVIRESSAFDECLTDRPQDEPWKCLRGPRSGTPLGNAVHDWLRAEFGAIPQLRALQTQRFDVARFRPRAYGLVVDFDTGTESVAVFPWYYRGSTPPGGVRGELVDVGDGSALGSLGAGDLAGKIAVMEISLFFNSEDGKAPARLDALRDKGAIAAIVATDAPANAIAVQNYDSALGPAGLPTLIVGREDGARLGAAQGRTATVTLDAEYGNGEMRNTIAALPGADADNIVVVATPLNAWLTAAGERGPGVGTLVYLARYFAQRSRESGPLPYTIWFVGSGAHEIMGFGIDRFLSCFDAQRIVAYVHLGSGLVYSGYREPLLGGAEPEPTGGLSQTRTLAVSENAMLQSIATPAFSDPVLQPYFALPPSLFVPGENRGPYAMGIPTVGMNGSNAYFHTPRDDEAQILRAALGPMATAFRDTVEGLLEVDADALRSANALAASLGGGLARPAFWSCAEPLREP